MSTLLKHLKEHSENLRKLILLFSLFFCMTLYSYLIQYLPQNWLSLIIQQVLPSSLLGGDLDSYFQRFTFSFLLLGLLPVGLALILGFRPSELGWRRTEAQLQSRSYRTPLAFWLLFVLIPIGMIFASKEPALSAFYPYSKSLANSAASEFQNSWLSPSYALHISLYVLLFYIPWEVFRGMLIFPFIQPQGEPFSLQKEASQRNLLIASMQSLPTAMLHIGHPLDETIGSIGFGLLAAWLCLRSRLIWPVLILHILAGLSLDTLLIANMLKS